LHLPAVTAVVPGCFAFVAALGAGHVVYLSVERPITDRLKGGAGIHHERAGT
jgi:hypothetical protein